MSNPTTTRVTATREVYTHHGEAAVTIEFYKSNIINIERITLDGARVLRQQLDDFLAEVDIEHDPMNEAFTAYWICNTCGAKENVRGATMATGPHNCPRGRSKQDTDEEVKRIDTTGKTEREIDRIESGMNINLNHEDYYTSIEA